MGIIEFDRVISCSSEDKVYKADNLLGAATYKKWKCANCGEKQVVVVLQLKQSTQITSVDMGNESSAFVEVLVGKATSIQDQDFQVLVPASMFLSHDEAKAMANPNKVRTFSKDQLNQTVVDQKWDRIKVVCTQPFNKHVQYGLAFITLHSPESKADSGSSAAAHVGQFKLKPSTSSDTLKPGSLFASRSSSKITEEEPSEKKTPKAEKRPSPPARTTSSPKKAKVEITQEKSSQPSKHRSNSTLEGVVFVLSGFQNPLRGELRDKATDMGAKYRSDWGKDCTHLVCAFANTPKFNQVKRAGGKIVSKHWILDCYDQKKLLSSKTYQLREQSSGSDTEEEPVVSADKQDDKSKSSSKEEENAELPVLPDFFLSKHFILYGDFSPEERRTLRRYITAFDGTLEEYMGERVQYVITNEEWDSKFDEALSENASLAFVKPSWVYACNEKRKLVPFQPHVVVPK